MPFCLPCITFKPAVGCDHVYARWFEGKFPWENQFAMIVTTYEKQDKSKWSRYSTQFQKGKHQYEIKGGNHLHMEFSQGHVLDNAWKRKKHVIVSRAIWLQPLILSLQRIIRDKCYFITYYSHYNKRYKSCQMFENFYTIFNMQRKHSDSYWGVKLQKGHISTIKPAHTNFSLNPHRHAASYIT